MLVGTVIKHAKWVISNFLIEFEVCFEGGNTCLIL